MKILKFEFENFDRLYKGTGKRVIKADLSKTNNRIILLKGHNGCGKTTLVRQLLSMTAKVNRLEDPIIPGENGHSSITFKMKGNIYTIEHTYKKKKDGHDIKSYLYDENGTLISDTGGLVSMFNNKIRSMFNYDANVLDILTLGVEDNDKGLVSLGTMQRRELLNSLLNLTSIEEAKVRVDDKRKYVKHDLESYRHRLINMDSIDVLNERINNIMTKKELIRTRINQQHNKLNDLSVNNDELKNVDDYISLIATNKKRVSEIDRVCALNYTTSVIDYKGLIQSNLSNNSSLYNGIKTKLDTNTLKFSEIKSMNNINVSELKKIYNNTQKELLFLLDKYKEEISFMDKNRTLIDSVSTESIYRLRMIVKRISDTDLTIIDSDAITLEFNDKKLSKRHSDVSNEIDAIRIKISETNERLKELHYNGGAVINEPSAKCTIKEGCPLYVDYKHTMSVINTVDALTQSLDKHNNKLTKLINEYDELDRQMTMYNNMKNLISELYDDTLSNTITYVNKVYGGDLFKDFYIMKELFRMSDDVDKYITKSFDMKNIYVRVTEYRDKVNDLKYIENVKDSKEELKIISDNIKALTDEINIVSSIISTDNSKLKSINKFIDSITFKDYLYMLTDELCSSKQELIRVNNEKQSILDSMGDITNNKNDILDEIDRSNKELEELIKTETTYTSSIKLINELTNDMQSSVDLLSKIDIIFKVLKFNMPNKIIDLKMSLVRSIANEFTGSLNINYTLLKFIVTPKVFKIPFSYNGIIAEDVSESSNGQKAILSLILAMSIKVVLLKDYNVFSLDELDATLDSENRESFFQLIEHCINHFALDQLFIITHNSNFSDYKEKVTVINFDEEVSEDLKNDNIELICV